MKEHDKSYVKLLKVRRRKNLKRKFLLVLKVILIIISFVGLVWFFNFFYNSQYFKIKIITIEGNEKYSQTEIRQKAEIAIGMNIFEINKKLIEDKLLNELIWLKSVDLKKIFPDKILITVIERKPFVKVVYGGNYFIIDDEAVVLDFIKDNIISENTNNLNLYNELLTVKNAVKYNPEIGEKIAKKGLIACGIIYDSLNTEIKKIIKEAYISDDANENIIFLTINEKQIIFGTSDNLEEKNKILNLALQKINLDGISFRVIDLRDINNPLIR